MSDYKNTLRFCIGVVKQFLQVNFVSVFFISLYFAAMVCGSIKLLWVETLLVKPNLNLHYNLVDLNLTCILKYTLYFTLIYKNFFCYKFIVFFFPQWFLETEQRRHLPQQRAGIHDCRTAPWHTSPAGTRRYGWISSSRSSQHPDVPFTVLPDVCR